MEFTQIEVISGTVEFANGGPLPKFLEQLPGAPSHLVPLHAPFGSLINKDTGLPVVPPEREVIADHREAALDALRKSLRSDLEAIATGTLTRKRRKEIAAQAALVTMKIPGDQRRLRPAYLEIPDLKAAIGYVLHIMGSPRSAFGEQLAQCKLKDCPNFFLRELRQARPECYCCAAHRKLGKKTATADRGRNWRARENAIKQLQKRYPASARKMIEAIAEPGLTSEELMKRAEAKAGRHK